VNPDRIAHAERGEICPKEFLADFSNFGIHIGHDHYLEKLEKRNRFNCSSSEGRRKRVERAGGILVKFTRKSSCFSASGRLFGGFFGAIRK
jgi:hypothetical protein